MTTLREAAEASLDALKELRQKYGEYDCQACDHADVAIIKLCAALEEPEQEPVAKVELMLTGGNAGLATRIVEIDDHLRERLRPGQLLYTAPPQRRPLTDEEIEDFYFNNFSIGELKAFARAIERAHGIGGQQ